MIISLNMGGKLRPEDVFHYFFKEFLKKFDFGPVTSVTRAHRIVSSWLVSHQNFSKMALTIFFIRVRNPPSQAFLRKKSRSRDFGSNGPKMAQNGPKMVASDQFTSMWNQPNLILKDSQTTTN